MKWLHDIKIVPFLILHNGQFSTKRHPWKVFLLFFFNLTVGIDIISYSIFLKLPIKIIVKYSKKKEKKKEMKEWIQERKLSGRNKKIYCKLFLQADEMTASL